MKLTEILVCVAIFLLSCTACLSGFVNVRKGADKLTWRSENISDVIQADFLLRKEIQEMDFPYWRSLDGCEKEFFEKLMLLASENGFEITATETVHDGSSRREGFRVEWKFGGRNYVTQEFIRQRIVDEKE